MRVIYFCDDFHIYNIAPLENGLKIKLVSYKFHL